MLVNEEPKNGFLAELVLGENRVLICNRRNKVDVGELFIHCMMDILQNEAFSRFCPENLPQLWRSPEIPVKVSTFKKSEREIFELFIIFKTHRCVSKGKKEHFKSNSRHYTSIEADADEHLSPERGHYDERA